MHTWTAPKAPRTSSAIRSRDEQPPKVHRPEIWAIAGRLVFCLQQMIETPCCDCQPRPATEELIHVIRTLIRRDIETPAAVPDPRPPPLRPSTEPSDCKEGSKL